VLGALVAYGRQAPLRPAGAGEQVTPVAAEEEGSVMVQFLAVLFWLGLTLGAIAQEDVGDKLTLGKEYQGAIAFCIDKAAHEAMIKADQDGTLGTAWPAAVEAGACGVANVAFRIKRVDTEFTNNTGTRVFAVEIEVRARSGWVPAWSAVPAKAIEGDPA
jgi:hypothetical protein